MEQLFTIGPIIILSLIASLLPIVMAVWALVLLSRLHQGQQIMIDRLAAIERLLQRPGA